jgi:hypothetical protein
MNTKVVILIALFCVAQGHVVKRDATTPSPADAFFEGFSGLISTVSKNVDELGQAFLKAVGMENKEQLQSTIQEKVGSYAAVLQQRFNDIKTEADSHTGKYQEILNNFNTKLQQEISDLQISNTTLAESTKKYQEVFQSVLSNVKTVAEDVNSQTDGISEVFQKTVKEIAEETEKTALDVRNAIQKEVKA